MLDKLDFITRFWNLRAREGSLGVPLSPAERIELLSLLYLLSTDHPLPEAGPPPRVDGAVALQLTAPGGFLAGELRLVCAGGIVIACVAPLEPGQSTVVRIADGATGVEHTLPCVVEWGFSGTPSAMALRVDGAPARRSFAPLGPSSWRSPAGAGARVPGPDAARS